MRDSSKIILSKDLVHITLMKKLPIQENLKMEKLMDLENSFLAKISHLLDSFKMMFETGQE